MSEGPRLTLPVGERDHMRGADAPRVTLLEYGDFECPQCGEAYPIVKELEQRYAGALRLVFRHFPLTNAHPHAQHAAEAAEWAASQGAFWPMHDALYEHQKRLSDTHMLNIAYSLGLDAPELEHAWHGHKFFAHVKEDFLSGIKSEVKGTPTFFVDGVRHQGGWDLDSLGAALERAIDLSGRAAAPPDPAP